jgi:quinol monooxygenase YgiN
MYAAMLHVNFPPANHDEVVRFLGKEMLPVIRDNDGFIDFQVMDAGMPGELVMIDTWQRREDSERASARPAAIDVHERYTALQIRVSAAARYEVVVASRPYSTVARGG